MRQFLWIAGFAAILAAAGHLWAASANEIISEAAAQRCGLTRAWTAQAQVDPGRSRLQALVLCDGALFAQSSRATLESIDAETGQRLWTKMIGQPNFASLPPCACRDLAATINGSRLFVLNRYTGDILYEVTVIGVAGAAPTLSTKQAYVPTAAGLVYSYRLDPITDPAKELGKINPNSADMSEDEKKEAAKQAEEERRENIRLHQENIAPLTCASDGRAMTPLIVTTQTRDEEFVAWVTDKGHLHLGRVDRRSHDALTISWRFTLKSGYFINPPAYLPPDRKVQGDMGTVFGGSSEGEIYALSEHDGEIRWKFSIGDPIVDSPVVIGDRLYIASGLGGLYAVEAKTGKQIWWSPEVMHFIAAGRHRIYAADKLGRLRILDGRTGAVLDILPTGGLPIKVCNVQTDRIYLATEGGLVQCLHEVEESKPIVYVQSLKPESEDDLAVKPLPKLKPKSSDGGAPKPVVKPPPKKAKPKDAGLDDAGDADQPPAKPTKPARGKATGAAAKAKAKAAADAAGDAAPGP
jgi:outer membrane protein assembly factor BamB